MINIKKFHLKVISIVCIHMLSYLKVFHLCGYIGHGSNSFSCNGCGTFRYKEKLFIYSIRPGGGLCKTLRGVPGKEGWTVGGSTFSI